MRGFIAKGLREHGFAVDEATSAEDIAANHSIGMYDACILDVMLPGASGLSLAETIRRHSRDMPIIIISALDTVEDKLAGFERGANDYLVKPFDFRELLARLHVALKMGTDKDSAEELRAAGISLNIRTQRVYRGGAELHLTAREFALLRYLLKNKNRIISRTELLERVWERSFDTSSNTVDVYINFLRRKIDTPGGESVLRTVIGRGYMLRDDGEDA